jgi:hypothetical protein
MLRFHIAVGPPLPANSAGAGSRPSGPTVRPGCSPRRSVAWLLMWLSGTLASASVSSASPQDAPTYFTVCPAAYAPTAEVAVPDERGGALVAWVDHRADPEGDVYIQRLDDEGRPIWIEHGVPACRVPGSQAGPGLAADGAGGAFLTWADRRSGESQIYIQHFGPGGLPTLDPDGRAVASSEGQHFSPVTDKDDSSGAFVVWVQEDSLGSRLLGQHFDQAVNPLWNPNGTMIDSSLAGEFVPSFLKGEVGALLIGIRQQDPAYRWLVQKVDALGRPVWPLAGISPCDSCLPEEMSMDFNAAGGASCAWSQRLQNGSVEVAAQRIGPDGRKEWGKDGVNVVSGGGSKQRLRTITGPNGGAYVVWQDLGAVNPRITAQRLNSDGTLAWDVAGVRIVGVGRDQDQPSIVSDGSGGVVLGWQASRAAEPMNIFCQRLGSSGEVMWDEEGEPVASPTTRRVNAKAIPTGDGGAIFLWEQGERTAIGIFAERISNSGFTGVQPAAHLQQSVFLWNPFPSPTVNAATLRFTTRSAMHVELMICDLAGRRVKTLIHGELEPSSYTVAWDANDESNRSVRSGVYYVLLQTPLGRLSARVVVL